MPKLAHKAVITKNSFTLDGEEFPWYIAASDIVVHPHTGIAEISVRIQVDNVVVENVSDREAE